ILKKVRECVAAVDLETVVESGYLMPYLEGDNDFSLFSGVGMTERPDTVCGKISEGRVAIILDGTPNVLVVPYLFTEYFQHIDDYSRHPYFATFTRWLKYMAFFLSVLLPGLYVAISTFSPEILPAPIFMKIALAVGRTPFSLVTETIIIHLIYEIMREAGLRIPRPLGHAVSIVGALVIGETAVSSGLIGAPTLMVVALTAISSYVIPNLYEPISILKFVFVIVGGIFGIWGIMIVFTAVLINICSKNSYGVPFTSPISPFNMFAMRDVLVRLSWNFLSRKSIKVQDLPGSEIEK
ncbi:MAG: spore germination protein, partial [Clostridia bacterium]|nr:spore germination protein [Clostridia bacterium]